MQKLEANGLTAVEAAERLIKHGFNELPSAKPKSWIDLLMGLVREPMIALLLTCALIYFTLGDKEEAIMLFISVFGVIFISLYQERKTEKSLDALRNLSSPRALVIRDGKEIRIAGREVVLGDILVLSEGDRVPADAKIIESTNMLVDESLLTGESVPVEKNAGGLQKVGCVYSGSMVVKGHGTAEVFATGINTEMGKIGKSLNEIDLEKTLLQKEVNKMIKLLAVAGLTLCFALFLYYSLTRGDWINGFLAGLTMAMGILPEEFPIVLTIFLAMGAWRLAQKNVLARRAATIETLGSATVLCVDKTGTLTKNKMTIGEIYTVRGGENVEEEVVQNGLLACQIKPYDPMELAFFQECKERFGAIEAVYQDRKLIKEYPVEKESLSIVNVWQEEAGLQISAKGAPETIFDLCHLQKGEKEKLQEEVHRMARSGYRVLAVARGTFSGKKIPTERHDIKFEILGLVGLSDPIRPEVKKAVTVCYEAGIRVVMITGDHPATAQNIANQIGLKSPGGVMTGDELNELNEKELISKIQEINIFSRVAPEQKLLIVNALKKNGEVVAMTGDGVNDAPALKSAHIGIAMGERGTDVAREAASIVLLNDDFSSIVNGVKLGRRIYTNLQKAMSYVFAIHVPIVLLSIIPVIFKWPLLLLPAHIVFLELVIDPTCTVAFEAEPIEEDAMKKKPRKLRESIFSRRLLTRSILEGLTIGAVTLFAYGEVLKLGWSPDKARALTFLILILSNVLLILFTSSDLRLKERTIAMNKVLLAVIAMTLVFVASVLSVDLLRGVFKFGILGINDVFLAVFASLITVICFSIIKKIYNN